MMHTPKEPKDSIEFKAFKEVSKKKIEEYIEELRKDQANGKFLVSRKGDKSKKEGLEAKSIELIDKRILHLQAKLQEIEGAADKSKLEDILRATRNQMNKFDQEDMHDLSETYGTTTVSDSRWERVNEHGTNDWSDKLVTTETNVANVSLAKNNSLSSELDSHLLDFGIRFTEISQAQDKIRAGLVKSRDDDQGISNTMLNKTKAPSADDKTSETLLQSKKQNINIFLESTKTATTVEEYISALKTLKEANIKALESVRANNPNRSDHSFKSYVKASFSSFKNQVKAEVGMWRLNTMIDADIKKLTGISNKMKASIGPVADNKEVLQTRATHR